MFALPGAGYAALGAGSPARPAFGGSISQNHWFGLDPLLVGGRLYEADPPLDAALDSVPEPPASCVPCDRCDPDEVPPASSDPCVAPRVELAPEWWLEPPVSVALEVSASEDVPELPTLEA
jgi:hypothetical protein